MCTDGQVKSLVIIIGVPSLLVLIGFICCCTDGCEDECRDRGSKRARTIVSESNSTDREETEMTKRALKNEQEDFHRNSKNTSSISSFHPNDDED